MRLWRASQEAHSIGCSVSFIRNYVENARPWRIRRCNGDVLIVSGIVIPRNHLSPCYHSWPARFQQPVECSRMSKKQWLALLLLFLTYLTLGATIFYFIESYYENKKIERERDERSTINRKEIIMTVIASNPLSCVKIAHSLICSH